MTPRIAQENFTFLFWVPKHLQTVQGSESDPLGDDVDWRNVQDMVQTVNNKQAIPKDALTSIKKGLKVPSKSAVCKTLTALDSIAANCSSAIRIQLAEPKWIDMLLSVCYKNPTAAMPVGQLLSNWSCSYGHEPLGLAAHRAAQALQHNGYEIPPPTPQAYHMVISCNILS